MDPRYRKRFKKNMIRLSIGVVLLSISYIYTLVHPAPKISMEYGLKSLLHRATLFWYNMNSKDTKLLEEKYRYEDIYADLLSMARSSTCGSLSMIDIVSKKAAALRYEPNKTLALTLPEYIYKTELYEREIKSCDP